MVLSYLATPYSDPSPDVREKRYKQACEIAGKLMKEGKCIFSPIAHTAPIASIANLGTGFNSWAAIDFEFLRRCDEVIVAEMEGWTRSIGVNEEINMARTLGFRILYYNPETEKLSSCPTRANFQETVSEMKSKPTTSSELN